MDDQAFLQFRVVEIVEMQTETDPEQIATLFLRSRTADQIALEVTPELANQLGVFLTGYLKQFPGGRHPQ